MRFHSALIGAVLAAQSTTTTVAGVRIAEDPGGPIAAYLDGFTRLRDSGERIIIDGRCYSACTLVLAVIPRERICVTSRATLGFHAAWTPGDNGTQVTSRWATDHMWSIYPANIRGWLKRRGGLTRKMVYLRGRELMAMYSPCR